MIKDLLEDVNLDSIIIGPDGKSVSLKFIDMYGGELRNTITCSSVYMFNYQNFFEGDNGFACYVGEVKCERVEKELVSAWLNENNFKFFNSDGTVNLPRGKDIFWLHLEGGEILIDIACLQLDLDGSLIG